MPRDPFKGLTILPESPVEQLTTTPETPLQAQDQDPFRGLDIIQPAAAVTKPEKKESELTKAFISGFEENITGLAARGISKLQGTSKGTKTFPDFQPETIPEHLASFAGMLADPAGFGVGGLAFKGVGALLPKTGKLFPKLVRKVDFERAKATFDRTKAVAGTTVKMARAKQATMDLLKARAQKALVKGPAPFVAYEGSRNLLNQYLDDQDFSFSDLAQDVAAGYGFGALFSVPFQAVAEPARRLLTKNKVQKLGDTLFARSKRGQQQTRSEQFLANQKERLSLKNAARQEKIQNPLIDEPRRIRLQKDINATNRKIKAIDEEVDALRVAREFVVGNRSKLGRTVNLMSPVSRQELVDTTISVATEDVNRLVSRGIIKARHKNDFLREHVQDMLRNGGIRRVGAARPQASRFLNSIEKFSAIDNRTGLDSSGAIHLIVRGENIKGNTALAFLQDVEGATQALKKRGLSGQEIANKFRYIESRAIGDEPFFNPIAKTEGFHKRPQFTGNAPVGEELELFKNLRREYDRAFANTPDLVAQERYGRGYLPLIEDTTRKAPPLKRGKTIGRLERAERPSILERRTRGQWNPGFHLTDMSEINLVYSHRYSTHAAFREAIPKVIKEMKKAVIMGETDVAVDLGKTMETILGFKDKALVTDLLTDEIYKANQGLVNRIAQSVPKQETFWKEFFTVLRKATFVNLVGGNPRTIFLKQPFQPDWVGGAEIGAGSVFKGRQIVLRPKSKLDRQINKLAKESDRGSRLNSRDALQEIGYIAKPRKGLQLLENALTFPTRFGMFLFDKTDVLNRRTMFAGAYHKAYRAFEKEGLAGLNKQLEGMLAGERQLVRTANTKGGPQAAMQMIGIIRSRRANYAYGLADSPEVFRGEIGRLIPFRTWTLNQIMRTIGDVGALESEASVKQLARRVALPIFWLSMVRAVTGYDIPGAHPLSSTTGVGGLAPLPIALGPLEAFGRAQGGMTGLGAAATELLQFTPVTPTARALGFRPRISPKGVGFKELDGGALESFLRVRPAKEDSFEVKLMKSIRKLAK